MSDCKPDLIIVGAGIFGLSVAWAARRRGMSVRVLEAAHVGAGASGGIVGALTPHAPSRWRPMMAFQFDALLALSEHVQDLEAASGHSVGYSRSGRLTPLVSEKARASAERDVVAAPGTWAGRAEYRVLEQVPEAFTQWISPEAAPYGVVLDTVSARIDPRAYLRVLASLLSGFVSEGVKVGQIDPIGRSVQIDGDTLSAGAIVLAAGWQVWDLLKAFEPMLQGTPVKGQAAMFKASAEGLPVIYQDGLYMVPHENGRIAVGSTSEKDFGSPNATDEHLSQLIERARKMCPALNGAEVTERWAGLRPKPPGREPVIGQLPDHPGIWLAAGGFKISFGIAHAVADCLIRSIEGRAPGNELPISFSPAYQKNKLLERV